MNVLNQSDWDTFLNEKLRSDFSGHFCGPGVSGLQICPQISDHEIRKLLEESVCELGQRREIEEEELPNGSICLTAIVDKKPFCQVLFSQNPDPNFTEITQFSLV